MRGTVHRNIMGFDPTKDGLFALGTAQTILRFDGSTWCRSTSLPFRKRLLKNVVSIVGNSYCLYAATPNAIWERCTARAVAGR